MREALIVLLLLTAGVFLFYGSAVRGYFLADDWWFINDTSFGEAWKSFSGTWIGGLRGIGGFYRPLTRLLFMLDSNLYGLEPWGYHLTNLLLHVANAFMVYLVARRLLRAFFPALAAAIAFLVFPTHPEAVYWISGRTDLLFLFCSLLAIYCYIVFRERSQGIPALALLFFALGLMAKESAITVPFLIIVLDLCFFRERLQLKSALRCYGLFFVLLILYFGYRVTFLGGLGGYPEQKANLAPRAFAFAFLDTSYVLFNPLRIAGAGELRAIWAICMIAVFVLMLHRRVPRVFLFGYLWMLVSSLLLVNIELWGRFLYEASVGFCLLLGGVFAIVAGRLRGRARIGTLVALFAVVVVVYGASLRGRVANWERASEIAQDIVTQVHRLEPAPADRSVFVVMHDTMNIVFRTTPLNYYHGARLFPYDHVKNAIARSYPGKQITCTWGFAPNVEYPDNAAVFYVSSDYRVTRLRIAERRATQIAASHISSDWLPFGELRASLNRGGNLQVIVRDALSYLQSLPMELEGRYALLRFKLRSDTLGIGRIFWGKGDAPIDWNASHFFSFNGDWVFREYFLNLGMMRNANCLRFSPIDRAGVVEVGTIELLLFALR